MCISKILKFTQKYRNFSHRRNQWLCKYLPSLTFHSGKSYVEKLSVYVLGICANFPCKIEKFELEVVGVAILGTGFCFQGNH